MGCAFLKNLSFSESLVALMSFREPSANPSELQKWSVCVCRWQRAWMWQLKLVLDCNTFSKCTIAEFVLFSELDILLYVCVVENCCSPPKTDKQVLVSGAVAKVSTCHLSVMRVEHLGHQQGLYCCFVTDVSVLLELLDPWSNFHASASISRLPHLLIGRCPEIPRHT